MVKEIYVWTNNLVFRYLLKKKILRPNPPEQVRRLLSTQITADLSLHCSGEYNICLLVHADAKMLLLLSETSSNSFKNHGYIWSAISKYGIYFENSFLMDKCSCKRKQKGCFDIFKVCGIFCNFTSQFAKTILWSLFILPPLLGDRCVRYYWYFTAAFKVSKTLLYHLFQRSRIGITHLKPKLA